jgi:hypothetical protein
VNADTWVQTHDLRLLAYNTSVLCNRLLFRIIYEEKISNILKYRFLHAHVWNLHACMLNLHVCVSNQRAVWYDYNAAQCVDPTRMRVMGFETAARICLKLRFRL